MEHAFETKVISSLLGYGAFVIGVLWIWAKSEKEKEDSLLVKSFGYAFLAMFRFNLNSLPLPLGAVISLFHWDRSKTNRTVKFRCIMLGGALFIIGLFPIQDQIEQLLHPRDQMQTYLHQKIVPGVGFNLHIENQDRSRMEILTEKDEDAVLVYEALAHAQDANPHVFNDTYRIMLGQDHPDDRFRRLTLAVGDDGEIIRVSYENRFYYFHGTPEFREQFQDMLIKRGWQIRGFER
jgi:hypothetical protein